MTKQALAPLIMVVFAGLALAFALSQAVWVDETTQLLGLSLPFGDQLGWLVGDSNPIPGVPPDRMPPLSYWLGSLWAHCFGLSELSMRLFGIFAMSCGAPAIFLAAREIEHKSWILPAIALALVYLAPGTIVQAGEIRAYPLYFSFSAWTALAYVRALRHPDENLWLVPLGVFSVLAAYTHFFGVVMAGMLWLSLFAIRLARREPSLPVVIGGTITIACFSGLVPFILAATRLSAGAMPQEYSLSGVIREGVRMAARLWMHGVHWSSPWLTAAALLGMGALLLLPLLSLGRNRSLKLGLLLPIILALGVLNALNLFVGGFEILSPSYNLWMVPILSLFAVTALADRNRHKLAIAAAICLIGAHLAADLQLIRHSSLYSHGPGEWLAQGITDPEATVVIHDSGGNWGHAYFPLYYLTAGRVTQILRDETGAQQIIRPGGTSAYTGSPEDYPTQIYVRTRSLDSDQLATRLTTPGDCGIPAMMPETDRKAQVSSYCAFEGATIAVVR